MKTRAPAGCWVQDGEQTQQAASSQKRHPWRMHVDVWQNQYNIVKLIKRKKKAPLTGALRGSSRPWQASAEGPSQ